MQHLDSQDGALQCYYDPLLPLSRLLLPRSGLERSDFVHWPIGEVPVCFDKVRSLVHNAQVQSAPLDEANVLSCAFPVKRLRLGHLREHAPHEIGIAINAAWLQEMLNFER